MKVNDFVYPHGMGCDPDFEVCIDWDQVYSVNSERSGFKIRFTQPLAGYYACPIESESEFQTPYNAVTNRTFKKESAFYDIRDGVREKKTFDKSRCWVVRSRCKMDEEGRLVAVNYSVVRFLGMCGSRDLKVGFCCLGAFNPTPNDTNLEDAETARNSRLKYKQVLEFEKARKTRGK